MSELETLIERLENLKMECRIKSLKYIKRHMFLLSENQDIKFDTYQTAIDEAKKLLK